MKPEQRYIIQTYIHLTIIEKLYKKHNTPYNTQHYYTWTFIRMLATSSTKLAALYCKTPVQVDTNIQLINN